MADAEQAWDLKRDFRARADDDALIIRERSPAMARGAGSSIRVEERCAALSGGVIGRGVYIQSEAPLYIYTQLAPLKIQMLADASKDARLRAEQIASKTGSTLGKLLTARMGVMQVNPKFSSDVSAEGNNDKSTLEKDAMAVVTASVEVR